MTKWLKLSVIFCWGAINTCYLHSKKARKGTFYKCFFSYALPKACSKSRREYARLVTRRVCSAKTHLQGLTPPSSLRLDVLQLPSLIASLQNTTDVYKVRPFFFLYLLKRVFFIEGSPENRKLRTRSNSLDKFFDSLGKQTHFLLPN